MGEHQPKVVLVTHGDDVISTGPPKGLEALSAGMKEKYEVKEQRPSEKSRVTRSRR